MPCGVFLNRSANSEIVMITYGGGSPDHFSALESLARN
jgi:hypothetical protein